MKSFVLIIAEMLILFSSLCYAGKENNIWYFGYNAGLDFNTSPPTTLTDGSLSTREGVATISDSTGRILFYTNGISIWNRNHLIMKNGNGLHGNTSSTQSAIIVPMPGNPDIYYVFTIDARENNKYGLEYSLVDMRLQNGFGDVTQKNIMLNPIAVEKLTAVKHRNNTSIWVIAHEWGNNTFVAYLVNNSGLNTQPIMSKAGSDYTGNWNSPGYLKVSPDGKKIASAVFDFNTVEIFDFNDSTGEISNHVIINPHGNGGPYGLEFSPDGTKLYVSKNYLSPDCSLYVYNLKAGDSIAIRNSEKLIFNELQLFGALQLGPDGKIYLAKENSKRLGVINKPDLPDSLCEYDPGGVAFPSGLSGLGLPNSVPNYSNIRIDLKTNVPVCEGDTIFFTCSTPDGIAFEWTGPDDFLSNMQNPFIPNATDSMSGEYNIKVTDRYGNDLNFSISVKVHSSKISFDDKNIFNFGEVCVGKDLLKTITLTNIGLDSVEIDSAYIQNNTSGFTIINNFLPMQLDTNENLPLSINFAPQSTGIFSDTLIIESKYPCYKRWAIAINGISNDKSIVSLPDTSVHIGLTDLCLPLKLKLNCREITSPTLLTYTATIIFNADIFYATSITNGVLEENTISNFIQTLKIKDDNFILQGNDTVLTEICGMTLLGSAYSTTLTISDFSLKDTMISIETKNGSVNETGVCEPGLRRVVIVPLTTMEVSPNPASDNINFQINNLEKGNYTLNIISITGVNIYTNKFSIDDESQINKNLIVKTNEFPSGLYMVILHVPLYCITGKILIVK